MNMKCPHCGGWTGVGNEKVRAKDPPTKPTYAELQQLLAAMPTCEHGRCVPCSIDWANNTMVHIAQLTEALDTAAAIAQDAQAALLRGIKSAGAESDT